MVVQLQRAPLASILYPPTKNPVIIAVLSWCVANCSMYYDFLFHFLSTFGCSRAICAGRVYAIPPHLKHAQNRGFSVHSWLLHLIQSLSYPSFPSSFSFTKSACAFSLLTTSCKACSSVSSS